MKEQPPVSTHDVQPVGTAAGSVLSTCYLLARVKLTLARARKDANSKDCADGADSVCENTDSVCECRSKRTAPTMGSPAAAWEASDRQEFGCQR